MINMTFVKYDLMYISIWLFCQFKQKIALYTLIYKGGINLSHELIKSEACLNTIAWVPVRAFSLVCVTNDRSSYVFS